MWGRNMRYKQAVGTPTITSFERGFGHGVPRCEYCGDRTFALGRDMFGCILMPP
jgi:hypothetical protein